MARLSLPRGQRRLFSVALVLALAPVVWHGVRAYRMQARPLDPSGPVEGITSDLSREVPADHPRIRFDDVTAGSGLTFVHGRGARSHLLPEDMGAGAAWIDYDGDGCQDLYLVNDTGSFTARTRPPPGAPVGALFRNRGDGTFQDVTQVSGLATACYGYGATAGDYDGDGFPDLYITCYGSNRLWRNLGDGTFRETAASAGVTVGSWSLAATFGDYDRDGWLDLYVGNYVAFDPGSGTAGVTSTLGTRTVPHTLNPSAFPGRPKNLFRNRGDGTFEDVTVRAGVANPDGKTLNALFADLDGDGWPDLYLGNDVTNNALFHNRRDGTFTDASASSWTADVRASMGIAVGDFDEDGDLDMFLTHWVAQENALYRNLWVESSRKGKPALRFMDVCDAYGLGQSSLDFVKWGTDFVDIDNDGHLDLLIAQGSTLESDADPTLLVPERPMVYWNRGGSSGFYDVSASAGDIFSRPLHGRGLAVADIDGDGGADCVISQNRGAAVLLSNRSQRGQFLELDLVGTRSNRDAVGCRVTLKAGGVTSVKELGAGQSYLSTHSRVLHFGLGKAGRVDVLEVAWPSGLRTRVTGIPAGGRIRLVEGVAGRTA